MIQIGYLRSSNFGLIHSPSFADKKTIFYIAKHFGIELIYFNPERINLKDKTITGHILEGLEWKRVTVPVPKVIDNMPRLEPYIRSFLEQTSTLLTTPFTHKGKRISKIQTYQYMTENGDFKDILIPSFLLHKTQSYPYIDILAALEKYQSVILKPYGGSKGSNIHKITKLDTEKYSVLINKVCTEYSKWELLDFLNAGNFIKRYMLQPYIPSVTKNKEPFDIRILIRRKSVQPLFETFIFPRIGSAEGVVSNIHTGGYTMPVGDFLKLQYGDEAENILKRLQDLADTFPLFYQEYVDTPIFDLGLDIGIVKNSHGEYTFNLFEVNYWCANLNCQLKMALGTVNYYKELYAAALERENKIAE
ncbi:MAG: YheC/YheD family protein [Oscillospiraceae bacterium]|jgi:hypothetical protein|nr:YheC/YheD family protein [Oscillospiraceae bacterium]